MRNLDYLNRESDARRLVDVCKLYKVGGATRTGGAATGNKWLFNPKGAATAQNLPSDAVDLRDVVQAREMQ